MALTGSGVIFAIVVIAWLCYLVPLTLRRHDEAVRSRSVDRFSSAMRVLGRAEAVASPAQPAGRRPVAAPVGATAARGTRRTPAPPAAGSHAREAARRAPRNAARNAARDAARKAAARRRRVLLVLILLTAVVAGVALTGRAPRWSVAVPVALIVGFLVLARWQVSRSRTAAWERTLRTSATRTVVPVGDEPDEAPTQVLDAIPDVPVARRPAPQPAPAPAAPRAEPPAVEQPVGATPGSSTAGSTAGGSAPGASGPGASGPGASGPGASAAGSSLWDPLPVTLPTYVSKPRAERSIRTVDLTAPGTRPVGSSAGSSTGVSAPSAASTAAPGEHSDRGPQAVRAATPRAVGD